MPLMVDGHNLIPRIPGLSLQEIDDETRLIELLQDYSRRRRKPVEVYFDNAPPGISTMRSFGTVVAHFTHQGQTADDAIRARLIRLGRSARNWTVVSSDLAVQASARAVHARVLASETFARELIMAIEGTSSEAGKRSEASLSPEEVNNWLEIFKKRGKLK
jgi:predicted RNA-binding protein with PIN domain